MCKDLIPVTFQAMLLELNLKPDIKCYERI